MPLILPSNTITGGYEVANSLRFDDGSSDYLSRTAGSTGNRKTFTISYWGKRGNLTLGGTSTALSSGDFSTGDNHTYVGFQLSTDTARIQNTVSGSTVMSLISSALYRDVSAWYHFVWKVDTTQATESDRVKLYVNGVEQTISGTYPTQNQDTFFGYADTYRVGVRFIAQSTYWDGYLSEVCYVDGTALDATSFGEFDEDSGIWKPIDVSGLTFGTNGFYLPFENSSALGQDDSGNGNNFTVNNLTSIDQTTDSPTNNYCTLNPLNKGSAVTLADGNLSWTQSATWNGVTGTIGVDTGKWYWEIKAGGVNAGGAIVVGVAGINFDITTEPGSGTDSWRYRSDDGTKRNSTTSAYGDTWTSGDIIGIALDLDNSAIWFSKNGTWQNSATQSEIEAGTTTNAAFTNINELVVPVVGTYNSSSASSMNFGNPPFTISSGNSDGNSRGNFEYPVPSGYYSLNSSNLAEFG